MEDEEIDNYDTTDIPQPIRNLFQQITDTNDEFCRLHELMSRDIKYINNMISEIHHEVYTTDTNLGKSLHYLKLRIAILQSNSRSIESNWKQHYKRDTHFLIKQDDAFNKLIRQLTREVNFLLFLFLITLLAYIILLLSYFISDKNPSKFYNTTRYLVNGSDF